MTTTKDVQRPKRARNVCQTTPATVDLAADSGDTGIPSCQDPRPMRVRLDDHARQVIVGAAPEVDASRTLSRWKAIIGNIDLPLSGVATRAELKFALEVVQTLSRIGLAHISDNELVSQSDALDPAEAAMVQSVRGLREHAEGLRVASRKTDERNGVIQLVVEVLEQYAKHADEQAVVNGLVDLATTRARSFSTDLAARITSKPTEIRDAIRCGMKGQRAVLIFALTKVLDDTRRRNTKKARDAVAQCFKRWHSKKPRLFGQRQG